MYENERRHTEFLLGGIATVMFSTKLGVVARPMIT
jgi:hypothetical protein